MKSRNKGEEQMIEPVHGLFAGYTSEQLKLAAR